MGPPGGGRNDISDRFTRHMNIISIDSFDDNTMTKIFTSIVDWHFAKGFDSSFGRLGKVRPMLPRGAYPYMHFGENYEMKRGFVSRTEISKRALESREPGENLWSRDENKNKTTRFKLDSNCARMVMKGQRVVQLLYEFLKS